MIEGTCPGPKGRANAVRGFSERGLARVFETDKDEMLSHGV